MRKKNHHSRLSKLEHVREALPRLRRHLLRGRLPASNGMNKKLKGIGVDVVDTERFRALTGASRAKFVARAFTPLELKYCEKSDDSAERLAGTFAAKEAVFKAVGGQHFLSYEIRRNKEGKPEVWQKGKRKSSVLLSISHTKGYALAVAVAVKK